MADAIQKQVKMLLREARIEASDKEMACHSASFDEVVDRVERLLLELAGEKGDIAYVLMVLYLASGRMQLMAEKTMDEDLLDAYLSRAWVKTAMMGCDVPTLSQKFNDALKSVRKPNKPEPT